MTRKSISSVLLIIAVCLSGCDRTNNSVSPQTEIEAVENSDDQELTKKAVRLFGQKGVDRFEQMFQTGEFDFDNRYSVNAGSVIHYAAMMGDLNRVKLLVERGADVNAKDEEGKTPLDFAQENGHQEIVKWLKECGAK